MKLSTFFRNSVAYYKSGKCYNLRSAPGRGKTTVIGECPAVIGAALGITMGFVYVSCPTLTPADAIGYLIPGKDASHGDALVSRFTRPFWWYTDEGKALEDYEGGIIFLDEEDKADPDIKKIIGEMGLTGRCGPHRLPRGWVVWSAGNRRSDRSGSTRELDHLINRRCELQIDDDLDGWIAWAYRSGVPGEAVSFVKENPGIVFSNEAPEVQGPWCTPRSFVAGIMALMEFIGQDGRLPTNQDAIELMTGFIGTPATAQFMKHLKLEHDLPTLEEILTNPNGCKLPSRADACMLVCQSLAFRTTWENAATIITYIQRMPGDFALTYMDAAANRDRELVNHDAVSDWCQDNGALMTAIMRYKNQRKQAA